MRSANKVKKTTAYKDALLKKCIACKKNFAKKKVFGSCTDCNKCFNFCDACQLRFNQEQQEIHKKIKADPNYLFPMEVTFLSVESSREYPFLLKEIFRGVNTLKEIETYCYWKVVDGLKMLYFPSDNVERNKQIQNTTKWIDFSHNDKDDFVDLRHIDKQKTVCSFCKKIDWTVKPPFKKTMYGRCCFDCLSEVEKDTEGDASTDCTGINRIVIKELKKILKENESRMQK